MTDVNSNCDPAPSSDDAGATMEINTVVGCCNACVYCPQEEVLCNYDAERIMSLYNFKIYLERIPRYVRIDFSGMAEPWLNPHCTEMVLHAHAGGHEVAVFTTTVGMSLEDISAIQDLPFDTFLVHLPDRDPGNTNIPCDDQYLERIKKLEDGNIANLCFMTIGEAHPRIREVLKHPLGESGIINSRAGNVDRSRAGTFTILGSRTRRRPRQLRCAKVSGKKLNQNILFPDGRVVLCCMDYGMKHVLSNLRDCEYEELFQSPEYGRVVEGLRGESDTLCRSCAYGVADSVAFKLFKRLRNSPLYDLVRKVMRRGMRRRLRQKLLGY